MNKINFNDSDSFWLTEWNHLPLFATHFFGTNINRVLTEREGRTGEYWPEVRKRPVRLEKARLVSSLLYGTVSDSKMHCWWLAFKNEVKVKVQVQVQVHVI